MKYLNKLKSTTWEGRNIHNLKTLFTYVNGENINLSQKKILIIGPGGIVESFSSCVPKGKKDDMKMIKKIQYILIRQIESALRKTGKFKLKSFEIAEVLKLIKETGIHRPHCIYVADCEKQVLDTIDVGSDVEIKQFLWDIELGKTSETFDIIICYNVIQRLNNQEVGLRSVVDSMPDDGLISLDIGKLDLNMLDFGLKKVSDNLYQKIGG